MAHPGRWESDLGDTSLNPDKSLRSSLPPDRHMSFLPCEARVGCRDCPGPRVGRPAFATSHSAVDDLCNNIPRTASTTDRTAYCAAGGLSCARRLRSTNGCLRS
jgi:hypothetical protein